MRHNVNDFHYFLMLNRILTSSIRYTYTYIQFSSFYNSHCHCTCTMTLHLWLANQHLNLCHPKFSPIATLQLHTYIPLFLQNGATFSIQSTKLPHLAVLMSWSTSNTNTTRFSKSRRSGIRLFIQHRRLTYELFEVFPSILF